MLGRKSRWRGGGGGWLRVVPMWCARARARPAPWTGSVDRHAEADEEYGAYRTSPSGKLSFGAALSVEKRKSIRVGCALTLTTLRPAYHDGQRRDAKVV